MDGWIHYGLYVGIVGAVLLIMGIVISITLCCGFCCRRCCCAYGKKGTKTCWFILFLVIFLLMCILCILAITFTLMVTTGLTRTRNSINTLADEGVPGAFQNVRDTINPLSLELRELMNSTVEAIVDTAFDPVWDLVDFAHEKLNETEKVLERAEILLDATNSAFVELQDIFSKLKRYEELGYISGIPSNETVPDVNSTTSGLMADARQSVGDLNGQITNLTSNIEDVINAVSGDSAVMRSIHSLINSTTVSIVEAVDQTEKSFKNANFTSSINEYYDQYVPLVNKIRLPVLIVLCFVPLLLYGLWFLGALTGRYKLMLVGFWWAASICWLMMLLAMIHVILFVPIKDICTERDNVIRGAASQFVFTNGTDYASALGFTSPVEASIAMNAAVGAFLGDPDVILDCNGEETLITNLGLDIPSILNLRVRFDEATSGIRTQVNSMNISGQVNDTNPIFGSMEGRIGQVASNITFFNDTLTNYTNSHDSVLSAWDSSMLWNSTAETEAQNNLDGINAHTSTYPLTPRTFTYSDVDQLDVNDFPLLSPTDRQDVQARQEIVLNLIILNETVADIDVQLERWDKLRDDLNILLVNATELIRDTQGVIEDAWSRVNASLSLPNQVLDNVFRVLDPALDRAIELAKLEGLGKCKFVGDFVRNGMKKGICREIGYSLGGVGICISLLALLWFVSWPIILSSKRHFAENAKPASDFFEVEMTTRK
jgi:hypothetical protein